MVCCRYDCIKCQIKLKITRIFLKYAVAFMVSKKPSQVKPITTHILEKIKLIPNYKNYDLLDDRYPTVVCIEHYSAVIGWATDELENSYKFRLPNISPPFNEMPLPHATTRNTPNEFNYDPKCFLCD